MGIPLSKVASSNATFHSLTHATDKQSYSSSLQLAQLSALLATPATFSLGTISQQGPLTTSLAAGWPSWPLTPFGTNTWESHVQLPGPSFAAGSAFHAGVSGRGPGTLLSPIIVWVAQPFPYRASQPDRGLPSPQAQDLVCVHASPAQLQPPFLLVTCSAWGLSSWLSSAPCHPDRPCTITEGGKGT